MAEAAFTARGTTKSYVKENFKSSLSLTKNGSGQYDHAVAQTLLNGVDRLLTGLYNTSDPGNGMQKLLDVTENFVNTI